MWTNDNRARYDRSKLRCPRDVTDEKSGLIGPLSPPAKRGGNKRRVDERSVADGVSYILRTRQPMGVAAERPAAAQQRK